METDSVEWQILDKQMLTVYAGLTAIFTFVFFFLFVGVAV